MIHSDKGADPPDKEDLTRSTPSNPEDGLSQILRLVLQELNLFYSRDVSGLCLLYDLLHSPWLQALLKVYDCLQEFKGKKLLPATSQAQALSHEVVEMLHAAPGSPEIQELRQILQAPHFKALLSAHDTVAQKDFEPLLPPLPDNIPEGEEAMRIVCLVKNQQPLVYVRAMTEYWPQEDPTIPCAEAGLPFQKGDILQVVDQSDTLWWQARKVSALGTCAGLIPSSHLLKRKQRGFWWSQPYQPHTHLKSPMLISMEEEDDMKIDEKCVEADEETFESEELSEDKEEFVGHGQKFFIAGFRRSMRLCRRRSLLPTLCCPSSCPSAAGAPYEEVVRHQRCPSDKHRLIVLVGPSGVGVNELRRQLIGLNPGHFQTAVPHTTRSKKSYEVDGREYHYVSKETFESLMYSHRMLESGEYKGHFYGTSVDAVQAVLNEGKICVMDLEPQGIQVARTHELKPYVIFIKPSNLSCMKQSRKNAKIITDYFVDMKFKDEDLQEMEDLAQKMETQFGQFFDHVIVNDILQDACAQLVSAVQKAQEEPQWVPATSEPPVALPARVYLLHPLSPHPTLPTLTYETECLLPNNCGLLFKVNSIFLKTPTKQNENCPF
ncbi:PREDICTED: MAGUK p55 subfamily member 4 isoform X10 [Myotis davidii]|uniref:MAGUK p55 subfamily member 4 isoform X10 n=1 Tax=Myotis davidii TaxID=225400 RepID=UPI000767999A|nr:PREDICTED: MAGUK p55 subfamily member 4 isoform X10 [Myotis davidii]